jgi:acetyl esterase/lipase
MFMNIRTALQIILWVVSHAFIVPARAQDNNQVEDFSAYMPEVRAWNKNLTKQPHHTVLTAEGLAAARKRMDAFSNPKTVIKPTVMSIRAGSADIGLRIFRPDTIRAIIMDIHGGAWSVGSAALDDSYNDELARRCRVAVVSVDYRLAPEHPFPACIYDCYAAARWLFANARNQFGTEKILISGASAGAHLSALVAIFVRDSLYAIDKVAGLNLVYGAYDLGKTPSVRRATDSSFLPKSDLDEVFALVFPGWSIEKLEQPAYSPLFADLKGLPPALFTIGSADPLVDDTYFMESRWRLAGNKTWLDSYPECPHGFNVFPTKIGKLANEKMIKWINDILQ